MGEVGFSIWCATYAHCHAVHVFQSLQVMKQPLQVVNERVGNEFKDLVQFKFTSLILSQL